MDPRVTRAARPIALAVAAAAQIGLMAALAGRNSASALTLAAAAATLGVALATTRRLPRAYPPLRDLAIVALAGVAVFFLAPYLVLSHRYSDAPPGTELIYFACVGWGVVAVAGAVIGLVRSGRYRGAGAATVGALVSVTGAAGILASWERPSSFSPLIRFAREEAWMLVAGVAFVAGATFLARASRVHGRGLTMLVASGAGFACATVVAAVSPGGLAGVLGFGEYGPTVVLWSAAWALSAWLYISLTRQARSVAAGGSLMVAPVLLSLLSIAERFAGVSGPQPLVMAGVAGGTLLLAAGLSRLARSGVDDSGVAGPLWLRWPALALAVAGLACMFLPAITAHVVANRPTGAMEFSWALLGWETVGGWAVVSCALLLLTAVFDRAMWPTLVALAAPAGAYLLAATPYHVLTPWLSPDVQVDFGTEYASITFRALTVWPSVVVVVGAAAGLVVVLSGRLIRRGRGDATLGPTPIEES